MSLRRVVVALTLSLPLLACGGSKMSPITCNNPPTGVTYANRVEGLLSTHCTECHAADKKLFQREGAPSDVNLDTYDDAKKHAAESAEALEQGSMPPSGNLSDEDRCVLRGWINAGTPQ